MLINISLSNNLVAKLKKVLDWLTTPKGVILVSSVLALIATIYCLSHDYIIAYGDAESHLNIAKRVVQSLTPGFAQLGGIWLPLPHLLMIPFVLSDKLWRTGLAGSIVSGAAFVISAVYLYKLVLLITKNKVASFIGSLVFILNPNILYLQATPLSELTLLVTFTLSSYFFIKFLLSEDDLISLLLASFFGFCAALSRYDGWALVLAEAGILALRYFPWQQIPKSFSQIKSYFNYARWQKLEGYTVVFATLAFIGIAGWLIWGYLILGDPLYFTHSQFSAKSQQQSFLARGQLPAYHNLPESLLYYIVTAMSNAGLIIFGIAVIALFMYLFDRAQRYRFLIFLVLFVPFVFNVATLWLGQSVIFIPHVTQVGYEWRLFNVRYGTMMIPMLAFLVGYLVSRIKLSTTYFLLFLMLVQIGLFASGYSKVVTWEDGVEGLSSEVSKLPDAQIWFTQHYDGGLVLEDDFARTMSIIRTGIPMQNIIYIGNKPYWQDSLVAPEKYATWIIMQKNDAVWSAIYDQPGVQGRLYKYFQKVYTSPEILIFKRNPAISVQ